MALVDVLTLTSVLIGLAFLSLGTLGLLRFPDVYSRLHALTKADNLGLGFVVLGLSFQAESVLAVVKLVAIWILVLLAATSACYLVARQAVRTGDPPPPK
jgi:multicomponent Na+:H+ antiporter subunit G